jgi:putative aldouronate transport system substrate-binding protein
LITDKYSEIVTGRAELSEWDNVIADWKSRGGDDMRQEYEDAIRAANEGA